MLQIAIASREQWDEINCEFIVTEEQTLELEHSLVSLSKWEAKWCKPFLTNDTRTVEESLDYIRCMTLNEHVDPNVYNLITNEQMTAIHNYINSPMTATWFSNNEPKRSGGEQTTSETIYYQMVALNIPFDCEKWHLNRLLTLIRVCNEKNKPPRKMSRRERLSQNRALNASRRKRLNTKG